MDRKWWTLVAVCVGTLMLLLDVTVVNALTLVLIRSRDFEVGSARGPQPGAPPGQRGGAAPRKPPEPAPTPW